MIWKTFTTAALVAAALPVAAQARLTGTVSQWVGGSVTSSPVKKPLAGATVIVGLDLDFNTGTAGVDKVRGKVTAKAVTDEKGNFTLNVPVGKYVFICWKEGYTPQVDHKVVAPGDHDVEISKDKSMQGLHRSLSYSN